MGQVYRATDTNLGRQVAIKVLPKAFAQDADRLARLEREAKTLASLNHTNIAQIYGLERSHGTTAVSVDVLDLDAALTCLAAFDPRKSQLAELRFFGGLSLAEAGEAVGIASAERDWQAARAWLLKELRGERPHDA